MGFEHAWYMVYQYSKLPLIQSWQDTGILLNDMRDQPQKRVTKRFKSSSRLLHQDSLLSFLVKTCPWKHSPGGAYRPEYATPNGEQRHSPLPLHSGTADPRWVLPGLTVRRVNEEKGKQARTCCMLTPDILHSHIKQLSAPIASDFHLRKPSENFSRGTVLSSNGTVLSSNMAVPMCNRIFWSIYYLNALLDCPRQSPETVVQLPRCT